MDKLSQLVENLPWLRHVTPIRLLGGTMICFVVVYAGKIWYSYRFFKNMGIPTPKYSFFWGNLREIRRRNYSDILREWTLQYGKTYGYYEGHLPVLVTSDMDIIQEVFVKQYSSFSARKIAPLVKSKDTPKTSLFHSTRGKWKRLRSIMNPTFSGAKLRQLSPLMVKCTDRLIATLNNNLDKEIKMSDIYKRFTMETIWNCAFGIEVDMQSYPNNPYLLNSEKIFRRSEDPPLIMLMCIFVSEFKNFILDVRLAINIMIALFTGEYRDPNLWINTELAKIIDKRKNDNLKSIRRNDYVQLLLDAESNEKIEHETDSNSKHNFSQSYVAKKLTKEEMIPNLNLFMLAGYETTSTTLGYCSYVLSKYPEEQAKLQEEISTHFSQDSDVEINTDNVQKLEYLEMFIKEVLRCYPIASSIINRRCTYPTTIKGIKCPVNFVVAIDVVSVHLDPDLWGPFDPKEFYPLRHSPEFKRNPLAFLGFGAGPRNCIGMKFALRELKITLVKLLREYSFEPYAVNHISDKLDLVEGIIKTPKNGFHAVLKKRDNN